MYLEKITRSLINDFVMVWKFEKKRWKLLLKNLSICVTSFMDDPWHRYLNTQSKDRPVNHLDTSRDIASRLCWYSWPHFCRKRSLDKDLSTKMKELWYFSTLYDMYNSHVNVNLTNILWAALSYESQTRSFYVHEVRLILFCARNFSAKLLIKCW